MIISVLKKEAKSNLKGKWKKAIIFMLLYFIITILMSYITGLIMQKTMYGLLGIIFNIVITVAIGYGIMGSFISLKRDEKINCLHFIYYAAKDIEKVWKVIGRLMLRMSLSIFGFLLSIYLVITESIALYYGYGVRLSYFVEIICLIAITIYIVMQMLYYSLNNYILFDNNKMKAKEILNESKRLMKNHRWDFVKISLSFIGWLILGTIFSVGIILLLYYFAHINNYALIYISYIPLVFILPYLYTTYTCFYDNVLYNTPKPKENDIKKEKKSKKKK